MLLVSVDLVKSGGPDSSGNPPERTPLLWGTIVNDQTGTDERGNYRYVLTARLNFSDQYFEVEGRVNDFARLDPANSVAELLYSVLASALALPPPDKS